MFDTNASTSSFGGFKTDFQEFRSVVPLLAEGSAASSRANIWLSRSAMFVRVGKVIPMGARMER